MDPDSLIAKADFLIEEERQRFRLAEERAKTYDSEATAVITAAIAAGAATVAAFSKVKISIGLGLGLLATGFLLFFALAAGLAARRAPEPLIKFGFGRPEEDPEKDPVGA